MRPRPESLEQFRIHVILERRHGVRAALLRALLYALSFIYERLVQVRLVLYRNRVLREHTLGCLVISIGNLTVGGTGKTPIVEKFARALRAGGRRVAILSRGYKSVPRRTRKKSWNPFAKKQPEPPRVVSDGKTLLLDSLTAGDEPYMLANNLKDVVVLVDKDRVKSGLFAIKELKADTLLLDDGLQYLHLKHRLVIVLVDKDRVKSGLFAIKELKADTLLLDDGLQYLHLKHRLVIVLVDKDRVKSGLFAIKE